MKFSENPKIGEIIERNGTTYRYDGYGWRKYDATAGKSELLPLLLKEYVKEEELSEKIEKDLSPYVKKEEILSPDEIYQNITRDISTQIDRQTGGEISRSINEAIAATSGTRPQHTRFIVAENAEWYYDWIRIPFGTFNAFKKHIRLRELTIDIGDRVIRAEGIIAYAIQDLNGEPDDKKETPSNRAFYLKDTKGILSRTNNWERIWIAFDEVEESSRYYMFRYGGMLPNGNTIVLDHGGGESHHSINCTKAFHAVYPDCPHTFIRSDADPEWNNSSQTTVVAGYEDWYRFTRKANVFIHPYSDGAVGESYGSSAEILHVSAHNGNNFVRSDIPELSAGECPQAVAVTARMHDNTTDQFGTSYGYGAEFCETWAKEEIDARYPDKNIETALAQIYTEENGRMLTSEVHTSFTSYIKTGEEIWIVRPDGTREYTTVTEIVDANHCRLSTAVTEIPSTQTIYAHFKVTIGGLWGYNPQQSPTCAIVAAKLTEIHDRTHLSWLTIRQFARLTASNSTVEIVNGKKKYTTHWDMYRGYGIIDVEKCIELLQQEILNNTMHKGSIVSTLPKTNSLIKIEDLEDGHYISKKMLLDILENYQKK